MPIIELPVQSLELNPNEPDIRVTKGSSKTFVFSSGVDLTSSTVRIDVRRRPTVPATYITKPLVILAPPSEGKVEVTVDATDIALIPSGHYWYAITATKTGIDTTLLSGRFSIEPFDQAFVSDVEPIMRLALTGTSERVSLQVRDQENILANPDELEVRLLDFSDTPMVTYNLSSPELINPEGGIFYFDFQSNRSGDFLAIWQYRFAGEEPQTVVKNIRWVTPAMFRLIPEIRLYIDKARKASNKTIAFNPVDIAEYIDNSLRDFNMTPPTTQIMLEHLDGFLNVYKEIIVLGAVIQSCIAQGLLAVDQDFVYNDNGISLAIDHSTKLQSWFNVLMQQYTQKKFLAKKNFFTPTVYARTIIGQAFALGLSKVPASTLARFRGWI